MYWQKINAISQPANRPEELRFQVIRINRTLNSTRIIDRHVQMRLPESANKADKGFAMTKEITSVGNPGRFPIRFDEWYGALSRALFMPPASSYVEVDSQQVCVQMSWAFRACFPRTAIVSAAETCERPLSRGVHGFAGRWLVNGSGQGILTIDLMPYQRGYVMGFPVRLQQLMVSVTEPEALAKALRNSE